MRRRSFGSSIKRSYNRKAIREAVKYMENSEERKRIREDSEARSRRIDELRGEKIDEEIVVNNKSSLAQKIGMFFVILNAIAWLVGIAYVIVEAISQSYGIWFT